VPGGSTGSPRGGSPGTPQGDSTNRPNGSDAPAPPRVSPDWYAVVETALGLRGAPYLNGGADPSGFDCSGFTQYVFGQHGIALPREVRDQFSLGKTVRPTDLVPGDLLFFTTTDEMASHVAIAVGGNEFVHAPSSSGVVRVDRLGASYWSQRFLGARRINQQSAIDNLQRKWPSL
jgi:cell wall-associated NlpC family hydrolase